MAALETLPGSIQSCRNNIKYSPTLSRFPRVASCPFTPVFSLSFRFTSRQSLLPSQVSSLTVLVVVRANKPCALLSVS